MNDLIQRTSRRLTRVIGTCVLLGGGIGGASVLLGGTAFAGPCGSAVAAGSNCTLTGTLNLTGGSLSLTSPSSLTWGTTLNGLNQNIYDTNAGDEHYLVNDATGTAAGWNVTVLADTFTTSGGTPHTLALTGTLATNGSVGSMSASTAPQAACSTSASCTLPTNTTSYPVAIPTDSSVSTPTVIYDTSANTGLGSVVIGGSTQPVAWWMNVPANTLAGTYTSTVTLEVISGP